MVAGRSPRIASETVRRAPFLLGLRRAGVDGVQAEGVCLFFADEG